MKQERLTPEGWVRPVHVLLCAIAFGAWLAPLPVRAGNAVKTPSDQRELTMTFELSSTAFTNTATIPTRYTADGKDISPPLAWTNPPPDTAAFVLICDDPDAPVGTWVHWVLVDIPPETRKLKENIPPAPKALESAVHGRNDFRKLGYGGPSPPAGKPHRYFFKLYAIARKTGLRPGVTKEEVLRSIKGQSLGEAKLVGTYGR